MNEVTVIELETWMTQMVYIERRARSSGYLGMARAAVELGEFIERHHRELLEGHDSLQRVEDD